MARNGHALSFFLGLALLLIDGWALACSSCGSGGADPVILSPNENQKFYLGLSQQSAFKDIDQRGHRRASYGPDRKQSLDLAFAQRLLPRLFLSAVASFGRNTYGTDSEMQNGDLSINARATAIQQSIAEPLIPQVQILAGHRFARGRSIYEQRREHGLDVFGAGYDETYAGADIWYGMYTVMLGGSIIFGLPGEVDSEAGVVQPGKLQRWIATVGGMPLEDCKLITGIIHEQRGGFTLDGKPQPQSDRLSQDGFLTLETLYPEGSNYRLSLNQRAMFGQNRNAVAAFIVTLAWMRSL